MSLTGTLNIGKTALATTQALLQVTGNNISNAGNADYSRQVGRAVTNKDRMLKPGVFLGTGINLQSVTRQIDSALENRLRSAVSDNAASDTSQQWLGRVESVFNELSDTDLSTAMSTFFNSWSDLANKPADMGLRQVVLQNGNTVASRFRDLRTQLSSLVTDVDNRLEALSLNANSLAGDIAGLNKQIVSSEGGSGGIANGLRDQRDAKLRELSQLIDIKTIEDGGTANVYVGSEPLVQGDQNRGVEFKTESVDGEIVASLIFTRNQGTMSVTSGELGSLLGTRTTLRETVDKIDTLASSLIFEVNKIHSSGQGMTGAAAINASNTVDDPAAVLTTDEAGLDFTPTTGSFVVHVKQKSTGQVTSTLVNVDLDGLNTNDTTLTSLAADLSGITNVGATISSGGQLRIAAASANVEISFSQDTSGLLAALGVNGFFSGSDARDLAVDATVKQNPALLAASKNGQPGDNQTALAIAGLESQSLTALNGSSLKETYQQTINEIAVDASEARNSSESTRVVYETLVAQRELLSGVSMDEEAINLVKYQRAYQAAARVVSAVDEMMQTMLAMLR